MPTESPEQIQSTLRVFSYARLSLEKAEDRYRAGDHGRAVERMETACNACKLLTERISETRKQIRETDV